MTRYGNHLAFPFRIGPDGRAALAPTRAEHVEQELIQLLLTDLGERLFEPELGTNVRRMVFEGADRGTEGLTKATIAQAIGRWLGERVEIENLSVTVEAGAVEVALQYRLAGTEDSRLVRLRRSGG